MSSACEAMDQHRNRKQRLDPLGLHDDSFLYDQSGLEILAVLQRNVNYNMGEKRFASDVIYHFKEHLMKAIAHNDIQQKLQFFWSRWHPLDEKESDWKKIYKLGLKGLPRMKEDKKKLVMAKAFSLVKAPSRPSLRSDSEPSRPHGSTPKKRPSNRDATPSSSRVQKSRSYSESPAQRKAKLRMSTPAVSS
ncbi:hypothetical protein OIDMADRAFT_20678 [Oidiodendron maius Zn]|uniref:Uncharacterized protein n=1 Tax=Oidiodendron maius (strain Zn) TaxID=913774 RepID=A0A0C3CD59_OIDMZ|nr:hypothetical protein OIDMADRAFT_20678 [Oidiodendron maius Zn]